MDFLSMMILCVVAFTFGYACYVMCMGYDLVMIVVEGDQDALLRAYLTSNNDRHV